MAQFYFSVNLNNDRTLCLAPLTERKLALAAEEIDDPSGYFLYEECASNQLARIEIIAKVTSEDAVLKLRDMFNMT